MLLSSIAIIFTHLQDDRSLFPSFPPSLSFLFSLFLSSIDIVRSGLDFFHWRFCLVASSISTLSRFLFCAIFVPTKSSLYVANPFQFSRTDTNGRPLIFINACLRGLAHLTPRILGFLGMKTRDNALTPFWFKRMQKKRKENTELINWTIFVFIKHSIRSRTNRNKLGREK